MDLFTKLDKSNLNSKYADRAGEAKLATGKFLKAHDAATGDVKTAAEELYQVAKEKHDAFHGLAATTPEADKLAAKTAAEEAKESLTSFLRGEKAHEVAGNKVQLTDEVGKELRDAFVEAESKATRVNKAQSSLFGTVRTQKDGFTTALKQNGEKMKFWSKDLEGVAPRLKAFAHGSAVVGSVVGMGDALIRSKNSEGEDRSALVRLAEFVVAGGLGTVALIGGPAAARA